MTETEVINHVARLKGLFPRITVEEEDFWDGRLEHFDSAHVATAVARYAEKRSDTIDRPALLELIFNEQRREAQDNRAKIQDEQRMVADDWARIDAVIADCSDQDLGEIKKAALTASRKLNDGAKALLAKMDPRKSKTLKWIIFQYLEQAKQCSVTN